MRVVEEVLEQEIVNNKNYYRGYFDKYIRLSFRQDPIKRKIVNLKVEYEDKSLNRDFLQVYELDTHMLNSLGPISAVKVKTDLNYLLSYDNDEDKETLLSYISLLIYSELTRRVKSKEKDERSIVLNLHNSISQNITLIMSWSNID